MEDGFRGSALPSESSGGDYEEIPYQVVELDGKGRGCVASRSIMPGI